MKKKSIIDKVLSLTGQFSKKKKKPKTMHVK